MVTVRKSAFVLVKFVFMIMLLTFVTPFLLDFSTDSLNELFLEVYNNADNETKYDFETFIDAKLCVRVESDTVVDFTQELAKFCADPNQEKTCASPSGSSYTYHNELCDLFTGNDLADFCDSVKGTKEINGIQNACTQLNKNEIDTGNFFMLYIQSEIETVEEDVFSHGSVHDAALETLHIPKILRFEDYLIWQRLLIFALLLVILFFLAGDIQTLTHKIGHVFVQTGSFLIIYRLTIAALTLIFGIDTSYLFDVMILSNGSISFSEIFAEVFFSLFLLMHQMFYEPTYWLVSILFIFIGFTLYIPWFIRMRRSRSKK